jgi:predicted Ser/Thr protein kinase
MAAEHAEPCPQRELIEAFAHDKLEAAQRREAERVLEENQECREYFRRLTAGRYPHGDDYTIIDQVGKGGFGVVYKAIPHAKERIEALKVLFSKTPLLTKYFENEVRLIARLRHPNIATLYDAQLSTPPLYYTMEFVEGQRLNDYVKEHEVSLAERLDIIKAVAQAIGYAHEQGVVHRDLKPQNVLVDKDGRPHIIDFGIAKKLALAEARPPETEGAQEKDHEGPVGTLGYIAPEQEKGGAVDERADIFALGALLFHCVTGEPARLAKVPDQRTRILRQRQVVQPEDLGAIIARCVEGSPEDRYATCAEFVADLDDYLAGRPIRARERPFWGYHAYRGLLLLVRAHPFFVRVPVAILISGLLTGMFWSMETTRTLLRGGNRDHTMMIGFTPGTLEAVEDGRIGADLPELSTFNDRSWRMLYGELFEKLAQASPRVVLWDSYPDEESEFDEQLARGLRKLRAAGTPVVVAAAKFDINGEPELCEAVREAVDRFGTILVGDPGKHPTRYEVTHCIERGLGTPIPGLALAGFAAVRFPDCDLRVDLDADDLKLELQYRKRDPKRGESHYEEDTDPFSLHSVETFEVGNKAFRDVFLRQREALHDGDKIANALVDTHPNAYWAARTIAVEDVLLADARQLREWFSGRAVVIGQMRPPLDEFVNGRGEKIFGCQIHADAIDQLLAKIQYERVVRAKLAGRNGLWCGVAVISVSLMGQRRWRSLRRVTLVCSLVFLVGMLLGAQGGIRIADKWLLELLIAVTGLLTAGSLTFWAKAIRERQLALSPSAVTLVSEGPTLESTVLAETR